MGTRLRFVIASLVVALAGCGSQPGAVHPSSSPTASASSSSVPQPLIAVMDNSSAGSAPQVVRLIGLDGKQRNQVTLPSGATFQAARGSRIFFSVAGTLKAAHRDGSVETLDSLPAGSLGPVVASPDGNQWLFGTLDSNFHSSVYLGAAGKQPRLIEQATNQSRALQPFSWTARGPYLQHGAMGIGGYILFLSATGPVELIEPVSGKTTPINLPSDCSFSDWSSEGTVACFSEATPMHLMLRHPDGTVTAAALDDTRFRVAGDAYFGSNATELLVGGATDAGTYGQPEQFATALVNVRDGSVRMLRPDGLRPALGPDSLLSNGTVIAYRPTGAAGGPAGVFVLSASGAVTQVSAGGLPVGLLTS